MSEKLCVVMPVYNEQDAIAVVLRKWDAALSVLGIDYVIRPYNDGSKDDSLAVMMHVAGAMPRVDIRDKPNGGHGNTILTGYREAADNGFDWVFQIDSDDEMGPEKFAELWSCRQNYDFLVGMRDGRVQMLSRKVISFVSRLCVRAFYGKSVWDVNTPYRLMRVSAFKDFFAKIPLTTFAPNVILSGLAARHKLRCFETRVPQHDRTTGEVSIKKWKLLKAAAKSFWQTIAFSFSSATFKDWFRLVLWGGAWILVAVSIAIGVKNGWREFDFQWDPAKLLAMGDNPYLYSLEHKAVPYEGFMQKYVTANQLPSCLLLLLPFTFLPQLLANQVWDIFNLFFSATFLFYFYRVFFKGRHASHMFPLMVVLLFVGTPWRVLIGNGQHLMFSLAFFFAAYYYSTKGRDTLSGILLALSAFKYTTIAPMAFIFVVERKWKPLLIAASMHIVATIACGLYLNTSPVTLVAQSLQVGAMLTSSGRADIASMLTQFQIGDAGLIATIGYCVFGTLLVSVALVNSRDSLLKLSTFAILSNVMFYHRGYDFVTLLLPLAYVITSGFRKSVLHQLVLLLSALSVAWIFFGSKLLHIASRFDVLICTALQHALLFALLATVFCHSCKSNHARFVP